MEYKCTLHWGWIGRYHGVTEQTEFHIDSEGELEERLKEQIRKIARRFTHDCELRDRFLHLYLSYVELVPESTVEIMYPGMEYDIYLKGERAWTRHLIETDEMYDKAGNLNLTPHPKSFEEE